MDIVRELRIYRLAFRLACEIIANGDESNVDAEYVSRDLIDRAARLEAATQNEVA